jgi:cell wall-associated protease
MKFRLLLATALLLAGQILLAQSEAQENWFNLDPKRDGVQGVSTERMYEELLAGKKGRTIIVAVIDSGVDPEHEDLKAIMWVNPGEIPGNGIDDDGNGYIDDVHGWNFIGGKDGQNVSYDNLEGPRLVAKYRDYFKGKDVAKLSKKDRKTYEFYTSLKEEIEAKRAEMASNLEFYTALSNSLGALKEQMGKDEVTKDELNSFETEDPQLLQALGVLNNIMREGGSISGVQEQLKGALDYFKGQYDYHYNVDFDPRHIVGDNYADSYERYYGNNDVKGPDAGHGTHVAGIIGAVRDNDTGIKGVADNVRIMSVRAVPDGDERDKDVANSIIYAVDNGASVINMSFGKGYSWDKRAVDRAVKYARKKDVLLVHAAGNSAQNNDKEDNFPNKTYEKKGLFGPKQADNWLEIGALSWKGGENMPASFSNYGKESVDVFAPGVDILSTTPDQGYEKFSGTSMAAPVVAGVAAVIRSHYPGLTAAQVRQIIMASAEVQNVKVKKPGPKTLVPFSELSVTGGVVNAYKAMELASKTKGKKKIKGGSGAGQASAKPGA